MVRALGAALRQVEAEARAWNEQRFRHKLLRALGLGDAFL